MICLVDTELIEDQLIETDEAIKQIAFSDIILLNKTVNVNPEYLTKIEEKLLGTNPFLKVFTEKDMIFPVKEIFNTERDLDIEFKMKPGRRLAFPFR